jgi:hypothetical protein
MLVLRGSRLLRAWAGDLAREPAGLDFVVLPDLSVPVDPLSPLPYVPGLDVVQQWPEFADGAASDWLNRLASAVAPAMPATERRTPRLRKSGRGRWRASACAMISVPDRR